jgi:tetratricopeptide (TPR) repeat protein
VTLERQKLVWLIVLTAVLGSAVFLFIVFVEPFLDAQRDRDWQRNRLEGQRRYVDGQYGPAKIAYDSALEDLGSGGKNSEKLALTLTESGRIELLLNNYDQSEKDFSQAESIYKQLLAGRISEGKETRALLKEGLIRSISGLAQVHRARGQKDLAKEEYDRLLPMYVQWWQSQGVGEVEADFLHSPGKHKLKQPQTVTKADPVLCAQMAADLTDLASVYLNDSNFNAAKKVSYYLADLCTKAPINPNQKAKADLVYHRAFNLSDSEPGIADQF